MVETIKIIIILIIIINQSKYNDDEVKLIMSKMTKRPIYLVLIF
jgi:hypothetical protein